MWQHPVGHVGNSCVPLRQPCTTDPDPEIQRTKGDFGSGRASHGNICERTSACGLEGSIRQLVFAYRDNRVQLTQARRSSGSRVTLDLEALYT